jgi:hypothetical protein
MRPKISPPVPSFEPKADSPPSSGVPSGHAPEGAPSGRVLIANSATEPQIYAGEPGYAVAVAGRYLIHIHAERTTSTTVGLIRRALSDLEGRYEKFGYLCVMEPGSDLTLPSDVRESINAFTKRYSSRFTGAAVVFEKAGFHATVVRSLVTAISVASRASHPTQVFDELRAGIAWLSRLTPAEPTATRLHQIVQELRGNAK